MQSKTGVVNVRLIVMKVPFLDQPFKHSADCCISMKLRQQSKQFYASAIQLKLNPFSSTKRSESNLKGASLILLENTSETIKQTKLEQKESSEQSASRWHSNKRTRKWPESIFQDMAGASINPTNVNMPTPRETSLVAGSSVPCSFSCGASDAGDAYWRWYAGVMPTWTQCRIPEYQKMARSWLQSLSLRNALSQRPSGFKFVPACSSNFHMDTWYCRIAWFARFASWCMLNCVLSLVFRNCSPPLLYKPTPHQCRW